MKIKELPAEDFPESSHGGRWYDLRARVAALADDRILRVEMESEDALKHARIALLSYNRVSRSRGAAFRIQTRGLGTALFIRKVPKEKP